MTYFSLDGAGAEAAWFSGRAHDVPRVDLAREFESTVHMAAIGYGYSVEELSTAMLYGLNLDASKSTLARR